MIQLDGWITIGTKLKTDKFDQQVESLNNKIKAEEDKQKINIEVNSQLEQEQAKINREVEELSNQYAKAANEAERLRNVLNTTKTGSYEHFEATRQYEEQVKIIDELNEKLEQANGKQAKITDKISKNNLHYQSSLDKVSELKNKIDQTYQKQELLNVKAQELQMKQAEKSIENVKKGITSSIGQIGKMALAVLSIRTAYNLVRQASSTLAQYNKQYATDLEYIRFVIAQGIAPVLQKVVQLAQTLMAYINYLAQRLFGVNLFAKGSADAFKKAKNDMSGMAKSSKEIKNNLAAFDELNVLDSNKDTSGAGEGALAPSIDIGGLEDVEIPEWLQKIGDIFEQLREAIANLSEPLKNFTSSISESFRGFEAYIIPLIERIKNLFLSLYNQGIKPAIDLIVKIFSSAWQSIRQAWDKWGAPIAEKVLIAIEKVGETLQVLWDNFLQPIWQNLIDALGWLWDKHLKPLWDNILDFIGVVIDGILQLWNNFLQPYLNWFIETFGPAIAVVINTIVNILGTVIGVIADLISSVITMLKGIIDFIVGVFTGDWERAWKGIEEFMQGIWDGIIAIVKGAINLIIDFINGMIAGIETALNWIVDKINSLEITNPFTGEEIWSPNVPKFSFGRIPKLAKGGIIARPTQAIIGESGREAVMPLENNTEWMDILADKINRSGDITIKFTGSTAQLVRLLKPELEKEDKRTGKRLIVGGAY